MHNYTITQAQFDRALLIVLKFWYNKNIYAEVFQARKKRPFTYGAIVEHRGNSNSTKWIIEVIVLIMAL